MENGQSGIFAKHNKKQNFLLVPVDSTLHFNGPNVNLEGTQYKELQG